MGTRAMITKGGRPFIATHWDGDPGSLGKDLVGKKTDADIITACSGHGIDFADESILSMLNKCRFEEIAETARERGAKTEQGKSYTAKDLERLHKEGKQLSFGVMSADDNPIGSIEGYDDWAEYQYDYTDGKWTYRALSGSWSESSKSKFKQLKVGK